MNTPSPRLPAARARRVFVGSVIAAVLALAVLKWQRSSVAPRSAAASPSPVSIEPTAPPATGATQSLQAAAKTGEAAKEQLRKDGQYESLSAAFHSARYAVEKIDPTGPHSRGAEYFAANPKQQLRAWFGRNGIELASGSRLKTWSLELRLLAWGREGTLNKPAFSTSAAQRSRVEMSGSETPVTQWFENREEGVEQGFTIATRPQGEHPELAVLLDVEGTLRAEHIEGQDTVYFLDTTGEEVLHYSGLKAWDAAGRVLPARIRVSGSKLALLVCDAGARYPITIDPLFASSEARLIQDPIAGDRFGSAVALTARTDGFVESAIIGAPFDDTAAGADAGSAYVFSMNGFYETLQAKLTSSDGAPGDQFGASVAKVGDIVLIGAPRKSAGAIESGKAYIFARNGTEWSEQAVLTAGMSAFHDRFGHSVALSDTTALVGAPSDGSLTGASPGKAHVFVKSGSTWSPQGAPLTANDGASKDEFGWAVSLSVNTAAIGARRDDSSQGSAYLFVRNGATWAQQGQPLKTPSNTEGFGSGFGSAVAILSDTLLVGCPGFTVSTGAYANAGRAYVYIRAGNNWTLQSTLRPELNASHQHFGASVALANNTAVVGAPGEISTPSAARVFVRSGTSWALKSDLKPSDGLGFQGFGNSVAVGGEWAIVGVPFADAGSDLDSGKVVVCSTFNSTIWYERYQITADNGPAGDHLGTSVALEGDTALIGAPGDSSSYDGSAYVFLRTGTGWRFQTKLTDTDPFFNSPNFAVSVALSNNTALVGADDAVWIFVRNGVKWNQQFIIYQRTGASSFDGFGLSVALSGDTAVVGASHNNTPIANDAGSAYVFVRSGTSWSEQKRLFAPDGAAGDGFGAAVAILADTAIVGSPGDDTTINPDGFDAGSAYLFLRSGTDWIPATKIIAPDGGSSHRLGTSVALAGQKALVGAPGSSNGAGGAYVFARNVSVWLPEAKLTSSSTFGLGSAVAFESNTAAVGAATDSSLAGTNAGSAYIFTFTGENWSQQVKLTAGLDASEGDRFGSSMAISGNLVISGAPFDSTNGAGAGAAYAFFLGELPEVTQHPASRTVLPGVSTTFIVAATGYGPLQYQWRKNGFNISGAVSSSYSIPSVSLADAGTYDVVISNIGGTVTSSVAVLSVNALSQPTLQLAGAPPPAGGFVLVNLTPGGIGSGWRFVGEQMWRASGVPVGGLATGDREIEFRAVPGFAQPPRETVTVISGEAATFLEREYFETGGGATGAVSVLLKPDVGPGSVVTLGAQWRLLGDDDSQWRNSGATADGLPPGTYLIECKPVVTAPPQPPRATPTPFAVTVAEGETRLAVATYRIEDASAGTRPAVQPFETVSTDATMPFGFVGQLRTDASGANTFVVTEGTGPGAQVVDPASQGGSAGSASGFVVKARVVATVAHAVFDDGALSYVRGLQWLFQRDRGTYEPVPKIPRGAHVLAGYAAQRASENSPGVSQPESQNRDVAALYFFEDAGRAGLDADGQPSPSFSGFLASDAADNEFLRSSQLKILVGYPVDGVLSANEGRMHATTPANVPFTRVPGVTAADGGPFRIYTTSAISSNGGCSGGPLCVQFDDGKYYPAAIYLGGSAQTVVRAIDSAVIALFNAAETSGNGGNNNTGGGITRTSSVIGGGGLQVAALKVNFTPGVAINGGARWRLGANGTPQPDGMQVNNLTPNSYAIYFTPVAGFLTPPPASVTLTAGNVLNVTRRYYGVLTQPQDRTVDAFASATFTATASGGPLGYQWQRNGGSGWADIAGARAASYTIASAAVSAGANYRVRVTWAEGEGEVSQNSQAATLTVRPLNLDAWREDFFTSAERLDPQISGPLADIERDGLNTLLEFALNLHPKLAERAIMIAGTGTRGLPLIRAENIGGQSRLTAEYVRRRAAGGPGITYAIEFTSDVADAAGWSVGGTSVVSPIDATWERVKVTDSVVASPRRFGRLKATMP